MRRGFSLIELALLLVIAGGLAAASIMLGSAYLAGAESRSTRDKLDTIHQAVSAYARANRRLPCPADESVDPTAAAFGLESAGLGTCTAATTTTGEVARGVLPFQTLGLTRTTAFDAWGNRLAYYVDRRMTVDGAVDLWPDRNTTVGDIIVLDLAGDTRTSKAIYALLSTGADAHGSLSRTGVVQLVADPGAAELENTDVDAAGASTGPDRVLVQGLSGFGSDGRAFDDIVSYRLRSGISTSRSLAIQNCGPATIDWTDGAANCTASSPEIADGEVAVIIDSTGPATGSVTVSCSAGMLTRSFPDCQP